MEPLDALFNKAKSIPPTLTEAEAESLILNAKPGANKLPQKLLVFKKWVGAVILGAVFIAIVLWQTNKNKPAVLPITTQTNINTLSPATNNSNKATTLNTAKNSGVNNKNTETVNKVNAFNKGNTGIKIRQLPQKDEGNNPIINKTTESQWEEENTATIKEGIPEIGNPEEILSFLDSNIYAEAKLPDPEINSPFEGAEAADSIATDTLKTIHQKPLNVAVQPHIKRLFIKTDLLGYLYNNALKHTVFPTAWFNPKDVSGNKISLGVEYKFNRRLSLACNINYGFLLHSESGGSIASTGKYYEFFINRKGVMLSAEARYYVLSSRHGIFISPYLAYAKLQERVFYVEGNRGASATYSTISTSKGYSYGWGLTAGYKFICDPFFIEPSAGFIVSGTDKNYFNKAIFGQESIIRYQTLQRIELSIGLTF